jgi:hypothetical protein
MASSDETPFEVLGRIEVDLDALKASLDKSLDLVEAHGKKVEEVAQKTAKSISTIGAEERPGGGGKQSPFSESAKQIRQIHQQRFEEFKKVLDPTFGGPTPSRSLLGGGGGGGGVSGWLKGFFGGAGEGGGGESGGGSGGEHGARHSPAAEFAHSARIVSHDLLPAIGKLSPALAEFISAGAGAARTAVFFGGAIGGLAVGAAILSTILGKYVEKAHEATAAQLELSQSFKLLDTGRAEAQIKKADESISEFNIKAQKFSDYSDQEGEGFVQKGVARLVNRFDIIAEGVTGAVAAKVRRLPKELENFNRIYQEVEVPKGLIASQKVEAETQQKIGERAIRNAGSIEDLGESYDKVAKAIKAKGQAEDDEITRAATLEKVRTARQSGTASTAIWTEQTQGRITQAEAMKRQASLEEATTKRMGQIDDEANRKKTDSDKQTTQSILDNADKRRKALADAAAQEEQYIQKNIQRQQARLESSSSTVNAIADAENSLSKVRRDHLGQVESESSLEARLSSTRVNTIGPILAGIKAENAGYESQKRELEGLIGAHENEIANVEKLKDVELDHIDKVKSAREKLAKATADLEAKAAQEREQRMQQQLGLEDKRFAHLVGMGRVTMQQQMSRQAEASVDPRRTKDQQEQAEQDLFNTRKDYAQEYFKLYQNLNYSTHQAEIQFAETQLSRTTAGSKQWFEQLQQIAGLYKQVHEEATQIWNAEIGVAASEAQRLGRTTIRNKDVAGYVDKARRRDEKIYHGGRATLSDFGAAYGRKGLWETVDREGLNPNAAFGKMMTRPQDQLAETMNRVSTQMSKSVDVQTVTVTANNAALNANTEALGSLTDAVKENTAAQGTGDGGGQSESGGEAKPQGAPTYLLASEGRRAFTNIPSGVSSQQGRSLYWEGRRQPQTESDL